MQTELSSVLDKLAGAQHGLVTSDQAITSLGRGRKNRWVAEGRLIVTQPGVYRVAGTPQTWHQSLKPAALPPTRPVPPPSPPAPWALAQPPASPSARARSTARGGEVGRVVARLG